MSAGRSRRKTAISGQRPVSNPPQEDTPTWQLPMVAALHQICVHAGVEVSGQRLTAGLPLTNGDLPVGAVQIAAARVGLEAEQVHRKVTKLTASDMPCMAVLQTGQAAVLTAVADEKVTVWTPEGYEVFCEEELLSVYSGKIFRFNLTADAIAPLEETDAADAISSSPTTFLKDAIFRRKGLWAQLLVAGVIINLLALVLPLFLMAVYDRVVPNLAMETLWALGLGVVIAIGFEFALKLIRHSIIEAVALRVATELQHSVADRILRAQPKAAPRQAGAALSGLKEIDSITSIVPTAVMALCIDLPFFLVVLLLIYFIGGVVALAPLVGAAALFVMGLWANAGLTGAAKSGVKYQDARQNLLHDMLEGLSHIKASLAEGQFLKHWNVISDEAAMASKRARYWAMLPSYASPLIMQLVTIGVITLGVLQLRDGLISVGAMVACTLLSNRAMVPITTLNGLISRALQSLASFKNVLNLLALPQERAFSAAGVGAGRLRGHVRLVDASLAFEEGGSPVLQDVNITLNPGETVALVGSSGAGKTSLLTLLAGLYTPTQGDMFVDGFHINQYGVNDYRRHIGYAPQDARLFNLSLKDNILLGVQSVASKDLVAAINTAGLGQFVAQHEQGLAMKIGPNGERLSGGQRQAVLLARSLVSNPALLLLDEPTSAMDSAAEQAVVKGLETFLAGRTAVISTHRTPLLALADRILWLENGRIKGDGPRDEMIAAIRNNRPAA